MKKILTIAVAAVMALVLVACSAGVDTSAMIDSHDAMAATYNEMIATATENGWDADADIVAGCNEIVAQLSVCQDAVDNPDNYTQEQVDQFAATCDQLNEWAAQMMEYVSVPYEG